MTASTPVWLLDIDGVINAASKKHPSMGWGADAWIEGKAHCDGRGWRILAATPVIEYLRQVHESGTAEIRWHTTWQASAQAVADLLDLPRWPIADAPEFENQGTYVAKAICDGMSQWWKLPAAERVILDEKRPLIWTDDDIHRELWRPSDLLWMQDAPPGSILLVAPSTATGLLPKHLRQIATFIDTPTPGASRST